MKVSKLWLDKFFDAPLPNADVLSDALTFHAFEIDGIEQMGEDSVLDVKVTPNRGHDALSHRGIAKELSAILKVPLTLDPFNNQSDISKKTDAVKVYIDTPLCKRYIAGYVKGVKVGPSPKWLKDRLEAIGQRSINNVVDATNFVMFNMGQPLHAFDADMLQPEQGRYWINVRMAKNGETIKALDGKEYVLDSNVMVIADDENGDVPIGIAGVKGGMPAAITTDTKDIIIEAANFDGVSVRKTAQALKLRTDASSRFEQVLSPELAAKGMEGMIEFIAHMIGGEVVGFVDVYPKPQPKTYVAVTLEKINKVLGTQLTGAEVADVFARLGFAYKEQDGVFEVQPPFERLDLTIAEDLVEEVGRIIGYDKVPAVPLPKFERSPEINKNFYAAEKARQDLTAKGYSEIFTSVFAEQGERAVLNKVGGDKPSLRATLIDGLSDALKKNIPNKDLLGLKEIKLFQIGTVWKDGKEQMMLGMVGEKEPATEMLLVGDESPTQYEDLPLSSAERFKQFSKYPYIVRDISMWIPQGEFHDKAPTIIKENAGELFMGEPRLVDSYGPNKDGKTSNLWRLIFQSFERTLTEAEVNAIMEKISGALKAKGFEIR